MAKASPSAIQAGEAFVKLSADDVMITRALTRLANRLRGIGSFMRSLSRTMAVAGAAMFAPLIAGIVSFLKHADKLNDAADRMDATTEGLSRIAFAADLSASSLEDVEAANRILTKSTVAASKGQKEQAVAFEKLGIAAQDFQELDIDEKFLRIAETLDNMNDPLERSRFILALFGKSASQVLPLLKNGAEGLRDLFAEAEERGQIINTEDAKTAADVMDNFDRVIKDVKATVIELGAAMLGFNGEVKDGTKAIGDFFRRVRMWIKENRELIKVTLIAVAGLLTLSATVFSLGLVFSGLATVIGITVTVLTGLGTILLGILSPIGLIIAGITAIIAAIVGFTEAGERLQKQVTNTFASIKDTFGLMFTGIIAALRKGDLENAWKIVQYGMYAIFLDVIALLRQKWYDFLNFFVDGFHGAVGKVESAVLRLVGEIQKTFATMAVAAKTAFDMMTTWGPGKAHAAMERQKETNELQKDIDLLRRELQTQSQARDNLKKLMDDWTGKGLEAPEFLTGPFHKAQKDADDTRKKLEAAQRKLNFLTRDEVDLRKEAHDEIERDIANRIKGIQKVEDERKAIQDKAQADRIKGITDERDEQKRMIRDLIQEMNKPAADKLPVAPFPRVAGTPLGMVENAFGDSVRGLFASADFSGALALGPASEYAKKQTELQKAIVDELIGLRGDVQGLGMAYT